VAFYFGGDRLIKILNRQLQPIAILENAYGDGYEHRFNEVGNQWFTLPLDDEKNEHCNAFNFVEYTLDDEYIGLYRIVPKLTQKDASRNEISYECKHVISTLLDDVLFSYHQTVNWTTEQNIQYILDQQTERRWVLGDVEFTRFFSYKFENENGLLAPLLSIPQPFDEEFEWTYDTTVSPWVLNLVKPDKEPSCVIREAHNRIGIEKEETNEVVNRIYPLGYGEGVNQLDITSVNGGVPYIEDAESISKYGLQKYVWIDRRFERADELKANAESLLKKWANPTPMYRVSAADLKPITGDDIDNLKCGRVVRVYNSDLGTFDLRIMSERKDDARGRPGDIQLEVGSLTEDIATLQADLERKMAVNDAYTQGAQNHDSQNMVDNADPENPVTFRVFIPGDVLNVNTMDLTYETTYFRGYTKGSAAGGGTLLSTTSSSGGGQTTSAGGGQTTSAGGGQTSSENGEHFHRLFVGGVDASTTFPKRRYFAYLKDSDVATSVNFEADTGGDIYTYEAEGSHTHTTEDHTHSVSDHTHSVSDHDHEVEIEIDPHEHEQIYGIYKHSSLPSSIEIKVDGVEIPQSDLSGENINIVPYLSKDSAGRILRNTWHEITLRPTDELALINATLIQRLFISSHIGGKY
jgi:phage minor structural protein